MLDYNTYRKVFNKWTDDGVFKLAYKMFLTEIYKKYKINSNDFIIDSTNIQNMSGTTEFAKLSAK